VQNRSNLNWNEAALWDVYVFDPLRACHKGPAIFIDHVLSMSLMDPNCRNSRAVKA
jgi:hypothetical protein